MKKELTKFLNFLDEDELRAEILQLHKRLPAVRDYYQMELSTDNAKVVDKYKTQLRKSFFTGRRRPNRRGRSESNKILKEFRAIATSQKDVVELLFYRTEVMVDAIKAYRIESDAFYDSTVKSFSTALEMARKEQLLVYYRDQVNALAHKHQRNVAYREWDFWDALATYYPDLADA